MKMDDRVTLDARFAVAKAEGVAEVASLGGFVKQYSVVVDPRRLRVELVPDERRGVAELNGEGEVVSGIAVQRYGQNALSVIENVKARLAEILPSLPEGTSIVPVYDRSDLIYRAIDTLKRTLHRVLPADLHP